MQRKQPVVKTKSSPSLPSKIPVRTPTKTKTPAVPPTITIDLIKKKDFKMYKPDKDDPLDMFLASFLNGQEKEFIPSENIKRVSSGVYIFGTTKVHLRCINGKLIGKSEKKWKLMNSAYWRRMDGTDRILEEICESPRKK